MRGSRPVWIATGALCTVCTLLLLAVAGCRDTPEPFEAMDRPGDTSELPRRLTFSVRDDRAPAWSSSGDSILYSGEAFPPPPAPTPQAAPFRVAVTGGIAAPALANRTRQDPGGYLTTPVPGPSGGLLVAELTAILDPDLCPGFGGLPSEAICTEEGLGSIAPELTRMLLRVEEGSQVRTSPLIRFDGRRTLVDSPFGWGITYYPFHGHFTLNDGLVFRPSWSPDGDRVVFSDGLRLLVWDLASGEVDEIPGTGDGVSPAWSPDGEWIAFTRLIRGDSIVGSCQHSFEGTPTCSQLRTVFPLEGTRLELVRPDGTGGRVLWEGDEAAWTPDAQRLVYVEGGQLWVRPISSGAPISVDGTEGARDPAVSPDARFVAFSRLADAGTYDIWVTRLQ